MRSQFNRAQAHALGKAWLSLTAAMAYHIPDGEMFENIRAWMLSAVIDLPNVPGAETEFTKLCHENLDEARVFINAIELPGDN